MRIRKQLKQSLSLVLSTLMVVFASALLVVTIVDLKTDNTPQLVSNAVADEASQAPQQPSEAIPPPADEQEHAQEPPDENPAASFVAEDNAVKPESDPKAFDLKRAFVIIGFIVLVTVVVGGAALLVYHLTRKRFYSYEVEDEDEALAADEIVEYQEWEGSISERVSPAFDKGDAPKPDVSANIADNPENVLPNDLDEDFADIPRLFAMRAECGTNQ